MDLRTLHYFVTVAQELNITRAAEKLNMSQPPLSSQMRRLEEELGVTLFYRGKRRLQLTEEGYLLLRRAKQLLELADKTRAELEEHGSGLSGILYLGLVEGQAPYLAAGWTTEFSRRYPRVTYSLWNGSSDEVLLRLDQGLADLALIAAPYDAEHLAGIPVGGEPWAAVMSRSHPLASGSSDAPLPLSDLVGERLIVPARKSRVASMVAWFGEIGAEPDIVCQTSHYVDALVLAQAGMGVSIFPRTVPYPQEGVCVRTIVQPARWVEYCLVWNKSTPLSPLAAAFVAMVKERTAGTSMPPAGSVLL